MALETTTYIDGLVSTNPASGDQVSQADDHLRLIKSAILNTFPNIAGAVTPTHTELNYVDGVTSAIQTQLDRATLTSGTAQASTSGTSIDYTSIPSWVKRVTVLFSGVSLSGTAFPIIQVGDSGGIEASGYSATSGVTLSGSAGSVVSFNSAYGLNSSSAANVLHGRLVLDLVDSASNTWVATGSFFMSNTTAYVAVGGSKSLTTSLDRVRITTSTGTDTFDAGTVNILYE